MHCSASMCPLDSVESCGFYPIRQRFSLKLLHGSTDRASAWYPSASENLLQHWLLDQRRDPCLKRKVSCTCTLCEEPAGRGQTDPWLRAPKKHYLFNRSRPLSTHTQDYSQISESFRMNWVEISYIKHSFV